ncbi:hypothetical protein SERLADRAFT_363652 [Serpula lacrymans var. lacrymans S7.9]|uniref:Amidohydrolase 3 domain-containing protein n=1 Tax=Serpula lacrymans var. lacrymans (strain S7.9) TaxID=578457 RepID=F8P9P8_SERL9|nr:uncharacterized protein SERLADRAFT_363652 [Serpula lacrymans var. lacrymans S7.9]EGO20377.1 hypothetical protein SERLADRAFT_363652 [Serpula lacrymans var. lacrymans S7.9]
MDKKSAESSKQQPQPQTRRCLARYRIWTLLAAFLALAVFFKIDRNPSNDYAVCSESNKIYTVDALQPRVQCVVVRDSRVLDVGDLGTTSKTLLATPALKTIHLSPGAIIVPGLADAHAHILQYGFKMNLNLDGCVSVDEILARLKAYVVTHPEVLNDPSRWIQGMGWDQTKWPGAKYPTADHFDKEPLLRGRFISLARVDVHALWVSNRVMQHIGTIPEEIEGGAIIRGSRGKPTGIFVDNAMSLIRTPSWSESQMAEYFNRTVTDGLSYGLTSVHDAATEPEMIEFFTKQVDCNIDTRLLRGLRLYLMGNVLSDVYWGSQIPRLLDYGKGGRLNLRSFWEDQWQVNIHCIGDRANKVVLDIFEELSQSGNTSMISDRRPRIEHAQIMTLDDLVRVGSLGVIPSVQPTHATSDMWYAEQRLGPERIKGAYAYRTLLESSQNQVLPLGSDFPVEGINPLLGFYAAVTRLSESGESPHGAGGWYPGERLTREQALKGMTLDAAYAAFAEDGIGSLEVGKRADFVVLSRDIMTVRESEILKAEVLATVIDGRVVYGSL